MCAADATSASVVNRQVFMDDPESGGQDSPPRSDAEPKAARENRRQTKSTLIKCQRAQRSDALRHSGNSADLGPRGRRLKRKTEGPACGARPRRHSHQRSRRSLARARVSRRCDLCARPLVPASARPRVRPTRRGHSDQRSGLGQVPDRGRRGLSARHAGARGPRVHYLTRREHHAIDVADAATATPLSRAAATASIGTATLRSSAATATQEAKRVDDHHRNIDAHCAARADRLRRAAGRGRRRNGTGIDVLVRCQSPAEARAARR